MFEPAVLKWARQQAEWSEEVLASKLSAFWKDVTAQSVRNWENGAELLTPAQIRRLAELYKRPTAVFLLAAPPDEIALPQDRRTIGSRLRGAFTPAALLSIRRARNVQRHASELDGELGISRRFKYRRVQVGTDPVALAARIRGEIGVGIQEQFRARTYAEFFEYLRGRLERTGVITLRSGGTNSFPLEDARALSFAEVEPYVILINNHDSEGAKNFSLLHEFGHVLVRQAGICNDFTLFANGRRQVDPLEVFCNQFAASFLVPDEAFLTHRAIQGKGRLDPGALDTVVRPLTLSFKVSRFVILRKLLARGLIASNVYKAKVEEWEKEPALKKRGGRSVPPRTAILNNGPAFSSLVFDAYRQDRLSYAAASDYLGMKAKHMSAFARLMEAHGG